MSYNSYVIDLTSSSIVCNSVWFVYRVRSNESPRSILHSSYTIDVPSYTIERVSLLSYTIVVIESRSPETGNDPNRLTLKRKTSVCTPSKVRLLTTITHMPWIWYYPYTISTHHRNNPLPLGVWKEKQHYYVTQYMGWSLQDLLREIFSRMQGRLS